MVLRQPVSYLLSHGIMAASHPQRPPARLPISTTTTTTTVQDAVAAHVPALHRVSAVPFRVHPPRPTDDCSWYTKCDKRVSTA